MKKINLLILCIISFGFINCFEGHTGKDGELLKQYLSPEALKKLIENPVNDIWIVDVRPTRLYEKGHIPTAKSFPSDNIMERLDELPKDKYLILYCETGGRAQHVFTKQLEEQGYSRVMNWGGYMRWSNAFE